MNDSLTYIEALKVIKNTEYSSKKSIFIASSANLETLFHFIKANVAKSHDIELDIESNQFGTLRQYIVSSENKTNDILILFPWDLIGSLNWRLGVKVIDVAHIKEIKETLSLIHKKKFKNIIYFSCPLPPGFLNPFQRETLENELSSNINLIGAKNISNVFCLNNFVNTGNPFDNTKLDRIAKEIIDFTDNRKESKKILVTDLDETLWRGILGEDGIEKISADQDQNSFPHFIYQSYLKSLKDRGILLAICSKNDFDLVEEALQSKSFILNMDDFVNVKASYERKSEAIKKISKELNLGLEHFIFIDDNPVEIHEVENALPNVRCFSFKKDLNYLNETFLVLENLFQSSEITQEDKKRTEMYKASTLKVSHKNHEDMDISDYLKSLNMQIIIHDRSESNYDRAIQLINKTNQFNINGIRRDQKEILNIIKNGGKLITAELSDINGSHGEIISFLINDNNLVESFVMSCRVFQREIELFFLDYVIQNISQSIELNFKNTKRNKPVQIFLERLNVKDTDEQITICAETINPFKDSINKIFKDNI